MNGGRRRMQLKEGWPSALNNEDALLFGVRKALYSKLAFKNKRLSLCQT